MSRPKSINSISVSEDFPIVIEPGTGMITSQELQESLLAVILNCLGYTSLEDIEDPQLYNEIINLLNGIFETSVENDNGGAGALFGMQLYYMKGNGDLEAEAQYNGNIAWTEWSVPFQDVHQYGFAYDPNDRLTQAKYRGIGKQLCEEKNVGMYDVYINGYDVMGNIQGIYRNGLVNTTAAGPLYGIVDNLSFTYLNNKLIGIADNGNTSRGFQGGANEVLQYDPSGNLISQSNKSLTNVEYNYLDLPDKFTFVGGTITNSYTANGQKLRSVTNDNGDITEHYYEDGFEYEDGKLVSIFHEEGRIVYNGELEIPGGTKDLYAEWVIRDHLGNTRVRFVDKDEDGKILVDTSDVEINELTGSYHYYPFGMKMEGDWQAGQSMEYDYQYNGKQLEDDMGLGWNDYGARWYDASVGRFTSVDPLASTMRSFNSYQFALNNPIRYLDPDGNAPCGFICTRIGSALKYGFDQAQLNWQKVKNKTKAGFARIGNFFKGRKKRSQYVNGGAHVSSGDGRDIGVKDKNRSADEINIDGMVLPGSKTMEGAPLKTIVLFKEAVEVLKENLEDSDEGSGNNENVVGASTSSDDDGSSSDSNGEREIVDTSSVKGVGVDTIVDKNGNTYQRTVHEPKVGGPVRSYKPVKKKKEQ